MNENKKNTKYSRGFNEPPLNKDKSNTVILLMGTTCAGKTTIARALHKRLNNSDTTNQIVRHKYHDFIKAHPEVNNDFIPTNSEVAFTLFNNTAHIGKLTFEGSCSGTDLLFDVSEIKASYSLAKQYRHFIVFDGMLTTARWLDFIKNENTTILPVLLETGDMLINHFRIAERRNIRKGLPTDDATLRKAALALTPATKYTVYKKRNAFTNCINALRTQHGVGITINTNSTIVDCTNRILEALMKLK